MITLPPFKSFLASNIPSIYDNTLSYYDELTKLIAYLEQVVVPAVNETAGQVDGIQKAIDDLRSYVDHYFDNLDVQEEINNKLDDMAESGELPEIISAYLNLKSVIAFDTVSDMTSSENLINGSFARTYGESTIGDGLGCFYKIKTLTESDVIDGKNKVAVGDSLYAERITPSLITFDTFEDASDFALPSGSLFKTKGFYSVGDGGESCYTISSTSTNAVPYTAGLYAKPVDNYNVLAYGIKKDGTSSTSILSRIFGLKKMYFPKGEYLISTLPVNNQSCVEIYGDGFSSYIKCESQGYEQVNLIDCQLSDNIHIHHLKLDGMKVTNVTPVSVINCNRVEIDNCYITGSANQRTLNVQSTNQNYHTDYYIHDNEFTNYGDLRDGALIECTGELDSNDNFSFLNNIKIDHNYCHIDGYTSYTDVLPNDLHDCIEIDNAYNTVICNNRCETVLHKCISMDTRCIGFVVENNTCSHGSSATSDGIGIETTGANITSTKGVISKNTIRNIGMGIKIGTPNVIATMNTVYNCGIRCLICEDTSLANEIIISNNIFFDSVEGIYVSGTARNIIISHNQTSNITGYDIVVPTGPGPDIKITHDKFDNVDINNGIGRIANINGVFIDLTPVFRGSLYTTSGNLHFINKNGTDLTLATS